MSLLPARGPDPEVNPPMPCSTIRGCCPYSRKATAWASSCSSTDTKTTATQLTMNTSVPPPNPSRAAIRKNEAST